MGMPQGIYPGGPLKSWSTTQVDGCGVRDSRVGATEVWEIINLTADAHPIHLHLTQFQLINRQSSTSINTSKPGRLPGQWAGSHDWIALPGGVCMPAYGPPLAYNTANADGARWKSSHRSFPSRPHPVAGAE